MVACAALYRGSSSILHRGMSVVRYLERWDTCKRVSGIYYANDRRGGAISVAFVRPSVYLSVRLSVHSE